jgi:hypothetical protein
VAAALYLGCPWKAPEAGEVEEGHDHRRRDGGSPQPAPMGAGRNLRPGEEGGHDLLLGVEEGR